MEQATNVLDEILTECRNYTKESSSIYVKDNGDRVLIIQSMIDKLNIQIAKEYLTTMLKHECLHMIIIYTCITSSANKMFNELNNYTVELFNVNELYFNITKHKLVPKHIKLSDKEKSYFLEQFGDKIPVILKTDPISKIYHYIQNDIIKIIRPNNEISYRICK